MSTTENSINWLSKLNSISKIVFAEAIEPEEIIFEVLKECLEFLKSSDSEQDLTTALSNMLYSLRLQIKVQIKEEIIKDLLSVEWGTLSSFIEAMDDYKQAIGNEQKGENLNILVNKGENLISVLANSKITIDIANCYPVTATFLPLYIAVLKEIITNGNKYWTQFDKNHYEEKLSNAITQFHNYFIFVYNNLPEDRISDFSFNPSSETRDLRAEYNDDFFTPPHTSRTYTYMNNPSSTGEVFKPVFDTLTAFQKSLWILNFVSQMHSFYYLQGTTPKAPIQDLEWINVGTIDFFNVDFLDKQILNNGIYSQSGGLFELTGSDFCGFRPSGQLQSIAIYGAHRSEGLGFGINFILYGLELKYEGDAKPIFMGYTEGTPFTVIELGNNSYISNVTLSFIVSAAFSDVNISDEFRTSLIEDLQYISFSVVTSETSQGNETTSTKIYEVGTKGDATLSFDTPVGYTFRGFDTTKNSNLSMRALKLLYQINQNAQ